MTQYAFIWDMDGTLVDSYPAIVPAALESLAAFGLNCDRETLYRDVIRTSVGDVLEMIAVEHGFDPLPLKADFNRRNDSHVSSISAMPHAQEALQALQQAGHLNFVYTHRGSSCMTILEQNGLVPCFTEIVTALNGFPRKPEPDGILYLIDKYGLDKSRCFYVGDRSLDVEAAINAGISSILYLDPASPGSSTGKETYLVHDLLEIPAFINRISY
jgi:HAD superfamily hydrolase (TIGR01509 family)